MPTPLEIDAENVAYQITASGIAVIEIGHDTDADQRQDNW
jgi:hypothetical protein